MGIVFYLLFFAGCTGNANDVSKPDPEKKDTIQEVEVVEETADYQQPADKPVPHEGIVYYESTSPDAGKATPLYEYFLFKFEGDSIRGIGVGDYTQGSEPWSLTFNGKFISENKVKLTLNYSPKGEKPFSSTETWELACREGYYRIYRKGWDKLDFLMGAEEYHEIELSDIPEQSRVQLKNFK